MNLRVVPQGEWDMVEECRLRRANDEAFFNIFFQEVTYVVVVVIGGCRNVAAAGEAVPRTNFPVSLSHTLLPLPPKNTLQLLSNQRKRKRQRRLLGKRALSATFSLPHGLRLQISSRRIRRQDPPPPPLPPPLRHPLRPPLRLRPRLPVPNPNWLSKLILSPTRLIASGAGKVLSSVFGPESESSSDSGSGSDSSGDASASDDDIDSNDNDLGGAVELHKENLSSEIEPRTEAPINVGKVGAKHLIEKLILQENFSWEEYDKLIGIIKTRVVRSPLSLDGEGLVSDVDMSHLCSTAVVEAKKWLQERKLGSNSELDLDNATPSVNPSWSPHVTEGETGSPVDVAKSYMSERPPWASPCFNTAGQRCASPVRMQFSKEDTLFSIGGNPLSPSKLQLKRDSPISGSWNISEEIRKVRSKATEELLRASSSKRADPGSNLRDSSMAKIDWSASGHESNRSSYLGSNLADVLGERRPGSALLVDASSDLPDPQAASQPSASAQDDLQERVLPSPPAIISEQIKDLEGDLVMTEGKGGLQDGSRDTVTVLHSGAGSTGVCDGPKDLNGFSQQDGSLKTSIPEGAQTEGSVDANGFLLLEQACQLGWNLNMKIIGHMTRRLNLLNRAFLPFPMRRRRVSSSAKLLLRSQL
ncbi:uncharacterized protein LOC120292109 [Eucalyptus grandis]|nr:uncharacterized protein LOC120292109 [Eucalyptus grandis]